MKNPAKEATNLAWKKPKFLIGPKLKALMVFELE
jgi:hypothetical protein